MTTRTMSLQQRSEVAAEALKAAPAVAVAGPALLGMNINDLLAVLTIFYVVLQIGYLLHRWWRMSRRPIGKSDED